MSTKAELETQVTELELTLTTTKEYAKEQIAGLEARNEGLKVQLDSAQGELTTVKDALEKSDVALVEAQAEGDSAAVSSDKNIYIVKHPHALYGEDLILNDIEPMLLVESARDGHRLGLQFAGEVPEDWVAGDYLQMDQETVVSDYVTRRISRNGTILKIDDPGRDKVIVSLQ